MQTRTTKRTGKAPGTMKTWENKHWVMFDEIIPLIESTSTEPIEIDCSKYVPENIELVIIDIVGTFETLRFQDLILPAYDGRQATHIYRNKKFLIFDAKGNLFKVGLAGYHK